MGGSAPQTPKSPALDLRVEGEFLNYCLLPIWALTNGQELRARLNSAVAEELLRDHDTLNLARTLVDLEDLRVTHQLLDRVFLDVTVATEDLDGVYGGCHGAVGPVGLREAGNDRIPDPVVQIPGRFLVE